MAFMTRSQVLNLYSVLLGVFAGLEAGNALHMNREHFERNYRMRQIGRQSGPTSRFAAKRELEDKNGISQYDQIGYNRVLLEDHRANRAAIKNRSSPLTRRAVNQEHPSFTQDNNPDSVPTSMIPTNFGRKVDHAVIVKEAVDKYAKQLRDPFFNARNIRGAKKNQRNGGPVEQNRRFILPTI